jgi:glycosyltransferase involved in cell wall biosynthesis
MKKLKVLVLHPPMYPVNYKFYNLLGKHVKLTVFQFGEHPLHHTSWNINNYDKNNINFNLKVIGKGPVSKTHQLNLSYLKYLFDSKPDIVLSIAFWFPSFVISFFRIFLKFKFVILTNVIKETELNLNVFKFIFRKIIAKNVDTFIAASDKTHEYLINQYKNSNVKTSVQTIDVRSWIKNMQKLPSKKNLRNDLELVNDKIILLGVGNFTLKKNWEIVFESLRNNEEIHFLLIGSGKLKKHYLKKIDLLNLKSKVTILPKKDQAEIIKYYKASDVLVFPSKYDQFGFVVPEALLFKLPVLCSNTTGASMLIKDGYNGFLINPNITIENYFSKTLANLSNMSDNSFESVKEITLEKRVVEFLNIFTSELDA